ncbi:MAG: HIT domain-containing protein [Pusillimonas sp.]
MTYDPNNIFAKILRGEAAGQTVPHCHFHVIPRGPDTMFRDHAAVPAQPEALEIVAERIRACLQADTA